ncbi:MAG: TlpA family protein disulfide reductase [Deltaproteobacteria bacterium]|nr:TlpA family protein disulfide reductase [Deltaproteobacteria bacterium]
MNTGKTTSGAGNKPLISRTAIVAGVVILFLLGSYFLKDAPLEAGNEAPVWHLQQANLSEGTLSLASLKGKVVLLDFWSTTCPPCLMQIPILQRIRNEFPDVAVVGVAVGGETLAQLKHFSTNRKVSYPLVSDTRGVTATAYNVSRLPTLFIVDRNGVIVDAHQGFWPENELMNSLRKAMKQ